jgi:peptide/nickel transport system substrate-binding protein
VFRRFVISGIVLCCALATQARTRPHYGGTLRVETQRDPWLGADSIARRLTMDGLTRLDESGAAKPVLAVSWSSQNADHRWEFRLRGNVRFHDGTLLTAEAVAASLAQSCHSGCPWAAARAVGQTIVFSGDSPMPELPAQLARADFLISHADAQGAPDGTGPFRVTGFANGVMTFAASDDCWSGRPFVDTVELHPRRSVRDQWVDLSIGRADVVDVPPEMLRQAQQQRLNVMASAPVDLLALQIAENGSLANEKLRQAIALAVDRSALYNVIFQKQGEVTASLLPNALSGYAFLFSPDRDLNKAQELRGGAAPSLTLACGEDASAPMQLAAERIALNLREAGFRVQVASPRSHVPADIVLRRIPLEEAGAQAGLNEMLGNLGQNITVTGTDAAALYRSERDFLAAYSAVPLLYLPRAWAVSERVRELRLAPEGTPRIGDVSLEDAK